MWLLRASANCPGIVFCQLENQLFFLSSHLILWYSIVLEFPRGTVSWKVNSRILEKLLVALWRRAFLDSVFFFAMVCDGVERIVIAAQCFFISAWCEFKQTRTNGRSNLRWLCEGGRMFVRLGVRVGLWSGCRVMCREWLWRVTGKRWHGLHSVDSKRFRVHFMRLRVCRHTWTISKANTAAFTCTSHTNVQTKLLKFLTSTVKDTCHAHTLTHNSHFHFFFRFVLRLRPFRIYVCLCQSGVEHVCKFFDVEPSSAMKVSAWTCKCATDSGFESGFEWDDFYGKALDHVLQDAVSTENQVDFTERHKSFVTEGQRNSEKVHPEPSKFEKGRVHRQVWSNVLIFMRV